MSNWQSRFTSNEIKYQSADQFVANPDNPREHPGAQREALIGSLETLGWVAPVIVNSRNGYVLDGHARIEEALTANDQQPIPYIEVGLDDAEEAQFLTTFDWITALATYNRERTELVMQRVRSDNNRVQEAIAAQAEMLRVIGGDGTAIGKSPDEALDVFLNNNIKQVVLYFSAGEYDAILPRLHSVMQSTGAQSHTDAVVELLEFYENHTG